ERAGAGQRPAGPAVVEDLRVAVRRRRIQRAEQRLPVRELGLERDHGLVVVTALPDVGDLVVTGAGSGLVCLVRAVPRLPLGDVVGRGDLGAVIPGRLRVYLVGDDLVRAGGRQGAVVQQVLVHVWHAGGVGVEGPRQQRVDDVEVVLEGAVKLVVVEVRRDLAEWPGERAAVLQLVPRCLVDVVLGGGGRGWATGAPLRGLRTASAAGQSEGQHGRGDERRPPPAYRHNSSIE